MIIIEKCDKEFRLNDDDQYEFWVESGELEYFCYIDLTTFEDNLAEAASDEQTLRKIKELFPVVKEKIRRRQVTSVGSPTGHLTETIHIHPGDLAGVTFPTPRILRDQAH